VDGSTKLNGTLNVTGNSTLDGTLSVKGQTTLGNALSASNSVGTAGQVLMSKGNDSAPEWKDIKEASGVISETELKKGTTVITVDQGKEEDIPGLTYTIKVTKGKEKIIMFNIVGYAAPNSDRGTQGVFELFQNGTKISSAYAAGVDSNGLVRVPIPATLMTNATLTAKEKDTIYTFKVRYKSWYGSSKINVNASEIYTGSTPEDKEALLSKMLITIYNIN